GHGLLVGSLGCERVAAFAESRSHQAEGGRFPITQRDCLRETRNRLTKAAGGVVDRCEIDPGAQEARVLLHRAQKMLLRPLHALEREVDVTKNELEGGAFR